MRVYRGYWMGEEGGRGEEGRVRGRCSGELRREQEKGVRGKGKGKGGRRKGKRSYDGGV
jgi:hypothetical protein